MVAAGVLAVLGGLLLWSVLPLAVGGTPSAVVSGSMTPHLRVGDVVVTRPVAGSEIETGQVVRFADPSDAGRLIVHRVVGTTPGGDLVTRGDANQSPDAAPVERDDVLGVGRLRIPLVGLPRVWWQEREVAPLLALAVLAAIAGGVAFPPRPEAAHTGTDTDTEDDTDTERTPDDAPAARP
ncbi:hypothetical protein GCM10023225_24060 [Kineococcus glutinatus]|uniref:Signal peptidase I n=1 Tax=Kineococcus glutinatus TaxID=1070872 RepID=A0ABP9I0M9_9ACTN